MAGRTPAEAVGVFLAPLQQALACVTPRVLNVSGGYYVADRPHALALSLGAGDPVPLSGAHELALSVAQNSPDGAPTGRVALEEVLRLAITELGARPRRKDWAEVLEATQAGYEAWRTRHAPGSGDG